MNTRILLSTLVIWGGCFAKVSYAETLPTSLTNTAYWPQFYASLTAGIQRMSGVRSEDVNYAPSPALPGIGDPAIIPFSNFKSITNKNATGAAHIGCSWNILKTSFFIGPEIYIGQGNTKNTFNIFVRDPDTGLNRTLNATIQQSTYFGGALQVGFNWVEKVRVAFLLGLETSEFQYFGTYIPRSQYGLNPLFAAFGVNSPDVDYPPTVLNTSKWLGGVMLGFGIEKQIQSIRVGFDLRMIQYRVFKSSYTALAFEPETFFAAIKPKNIRFGLKVSYVF